MAFAKFDAGPYAASAIGDGPVPSAGRRAAHAFAPLYPLGISARVPPSTVSHVPITSAANPRFRELLNLAESARARREAHRTLLDGPHLVAACRAAGVVPELLIAGPAPERSPEVAGLLAGLPQVPVLELGASLLRRLSPVETPAGLMALIATPGPRALPATPGPCVLLEAVQDPGNLGSILRTTAAAGIRQVYLSPGCADAWSPRVLRAGMGGHFLLDLHEGVDLPAFARAYPGRVIATDLRAGQSLYATDLTGLAGLAFGNEGAGLSPALLAAAGVVVSIPMPGPTESLNIAAAAAVCLFERVRQQALAPQPGRPLG